MVKNERVAATLVGGLMGLALLWLTFAPGTVTRAEMQNYVDVTATEHLRILRKDLGGVRETMVEVCQRLAGVEAVLRDHP